jgi:hypothetical protein
MLGETHLAPELLTEPKLTITSTTHDGISTTREVKDLKLSAGSVLTHKLTVPERLASLTVAQRQSRCPQCRWRKTRCLASHTWTLNGIDKTEAVNDGHLSTFDGQRVFELLGKNGEPVADQQVIFTFKHRDFNRVQTAALRTDDKGRVALGKLEGIAQVTAKIPNGRSSMWPLEDADTTLTTTIHTTEGEPIRIHGSRTSFQLASLLSPNRRNLHRRPQSSPQIRKRLLTLTGLKPGDYSSNSLTNSSRSKSPKAPSSAAGHSASTASSNSRAMRRCTSPSATSDKDFITVKLAHSSPFARVHVAASRFDPGNGLFGGLGGFTRFGAASGTPARHPNLYSAGREIGDEYRYILERRYAKLFPGNMLTRPGLLLNPWEIRSTDLDELAQLAGEGAAMTRGGAAGGMAPSHSDARQENEATSRPARRHEPRLPRRLRAGHLQSRS